MENEKTMVENTATETVTDDTLQNGLVEEEDASQSLEEILTDENEAGKPAEEKPAEQSAGEPGYIKQRVNKAVEKAVRETEARMRAEFERQMAPIREKMLTDEARELVRQGTVKDLDTAKELVRYRQGLAPEKKEETQQRQEQPRNSQGQFVAQGNQDPKEDPKIQAKVDLLAHQADKIKKQRGVDVMKEFNNNEEARKKIFSGEWDFYDLAEEMSQGNKQKPPAPMRSPNGASGDQKGTISSMSKEQFARLEQKLKEGARYKV